MGKKRSKKREKVLKKDKKSVMIERVFEGVVVLNYNELSRTALEQEFVAVKEQYEKLLRLNLKLDMSRGKPGFENVELCEELSGLVNRETGYKNADGIDCRNYGGLDGLSELKQLFGEILGTPAQQVIVGGNSSLNMMFDIIAQGMTHGWGEEPWSRVEDRKFLCPCPGYDRHFAITEYFGFQLIPIAVDENGPDMDAVEEWVKDPAVKGIWCVPKYSNPEGTTYSDEVVRRMAALKPAAKDFRVMWDNAYVVHDLYDEGDELLNFYRACEKEGNADLAFLFTSTSKITFPGAGVAAVAASPSNILKLKNRMSFQTIGPDKINHLRHARMFRTVADVKAQMKKYADLLRPKFERVLKEFDEQLTGIARWTRPKGGYFISLYVPEGCARRVGDLCKNAGMNLTPAGATYPYGLDPKDENLRIAPSFPSVEEIGRAAEVLCVAVRYAALEQLLAQ